MSNITVLAVKDREISISKIHYNELRGLLSRIQDGNDALSDSPSVWADGGYVLLDFDSKTIVSSQGCINIHEFVRKWSYLDLTLI